MKLFISSLMLISSALFNSCLLLNIGGMMQANSEIEKSVISAENEKFEREFDINLTHIKRGLWSAQDYSRNHAIDLYYKSLLNNHLVYSMDFSQIEFAQQAISDNNISIVINNQFENYTEYEKMVLLISSTSALALLHDASFKNNEIPKMFFNIIESYNDGKISGIINAQWYKSKNITFTDNGIIIHI